MVRVGSGRPDSTRPARSSPAREKPCFLFAHGVCRLALLGVRPPRHWCDENDSAKMPPPRRCPVDRTGDRSEFW